MSAHTPGPWTFGIRRDRTIWLSIGDPAIGPHYQADLHASPADASLIVAAPDLYDAAEEALNTLIGCCVGAGGVDDRKAILDAQSMLRAAIAKAEGRS